ncbi:MAG: hypothetical protein L3J71_17645 [Victivallaceae bacterium]|nr:hypothetical protein [Victivallaceae bacterium]
MKMNPELQLAQENMQPGIITLQGFLGHDKRDLSQIIDEDNQLVKSLTTTHLKIAAQMKFLRGQGECGLGEFIEYGEHFQIRVDSVRGKMRCPFEDPGLIPKYNITVKNLALNREITYTDMNIHFIEIHGFYQGEGSLFRLNPDDLVIILEIESTGDNAHRFDVPTE